MTDSPTVWRLKQDSEFRYREPLMLERAILIPCKTGVRGMLLVWSILRVFFGQKKTKEESKVFGMGSAT